jgi:DNA invertase Pin-like site-specific DNA recombinase
MHIRQAVLYLRSSKDRSDVSIEAQRRELSLLAKNKELLIYKEFVDAVESAKDEHRPGFQSLLHELRAKDRPWSLILTLDTSRLSRRRHIAHVFKYECRKMGVDILYAKVPEVDPISQVILESVLEAMDEVHSLMSREKGLAGMAENIRQGWRAGGRPPLGYRLEKIATGAIRAGMPITKTKLVPTSDAPKLAAYLSGRAGGQSRRVLIQELGLDLNGSTLNAIEWNALTYAGHTVWNQHYPRIPGGYQGGHKRRPRTEWIIQPDTHEELITMAQAETVLSMLAEGRQTYRTKATYLLTGLLLSPNGCSWYGNQGYYRCDKKNIKATAVEEAVVSKVIADLTTPELVRQLTEQVRQLLNATTSTIEANVLSTTIAELNRKIDRLAALVAEISEPQPLLRQIERLEQIRQATEARQQQVQREKQRTQILQNITAADVRIALQAMATDLVTLDRERLKDLLRNLLDRIVFNPADLTCCIHYRISISNGGLVASPRELDDFPKLTAHSKVSLPNRHLKK